MQTDDVQICVYKIHDSSLVRTVKPHTETVEAMTAVGTQVRLESNQMQLVLSRSAQVLAPLRFIDTSLFGVTAGVEWQQRSYHCGP